MKTLARILRVDGYNIRDIDISMHRGFINTTLDAEDTLTPRCRKCDFELSGKMSMHRMKVKDLPMMHLENHTSFFRRKGFCGNCGKYRSEKIHFLSEESPHYTKQYAWALKSLCEITSVKQAAEHAGIDKSTLQRLDQKSLENMVKKYEIPKNLTHISIDEVYATTKKKDGENRDDQFFTIITDIKTGKVIWVEKSRSEKALIRFFIMLGERACQKIQAVSTDQHRGYINAVRRYLPNAVLTLDKFHVIKNLGEALNDSRKLLLKLLPKAKRSKLMKGKYRFIFLKKASRRKKAEAQHIERVIKDNDMFLALELIKERMYTFYDSKTHSEAKQIFYEIGSWCRESGLPPLKKWYNYLQTQWDALTGFLDYKTSTAVSEGVNNVIKTIKRYAYGYRNKDYFALKIMQRCGYLNTKYFDNLIPEPRGSVRF